MRIEQSGLIPSIGIDPLTSGQRISYPLSITMRKEEERIILPYGLIPKERMNPLKKFIDSPKYLH